MMKKILSASLLASAFVLSSCYCDKTYVGNVGPYDQVVHVASTRNAHIFGGAVVTHNPVKNFVGDAQDYIIATKHTIGDMLISGLTIGIYTPSTAKYYVRKDNPDVVIEKQKTKKTFKGHLKQ